VLICYQPSSVEYLLKHNQDLKKSEHFADLYVSNDAKVAVLAMAQGSPALALKMEMLIALGVRNFITVGTAGTLHKHDIGAFVLSTKALAEDGVAEHYLLPGEQFAYANQKMLKLWLDFAKSTSLPSFRIATTWTFSSIFKETPNNITNAKLKGCEIVEMEAATLYAIAGDKKVKALALFIISDQVNLDSWVHKTKAVKINLQQLAQIALEFCRKVDFS
jgi:purine-nucleoside phosphorylase